MAIPKVGRLVVEEGISLGAVAEWLKERAEPL
jgi:hypothetical protein